MINAFKRRRYYQISILETASDGISVTGQPLIIEHSDHEDLFQVIEKIKSVQGIDKQLAPKLGLGLRLFGTVALAHKKTPLFQALLPSLRTFIQSLKGK